MRRQRSVIGRRRAARLGAWAAGAAVLVLLAAGCGGRGSLSTEDRILLADIPRLKAACEEFKKHCGRYPLTTEGLLALVKKPVDPAIASRWAGPYLPNGEEDLKDPWGNPYRYALADRAGRPWLRIWSMGPDGETGTKDDIPRATTDPPKPLPGGRGGRG